MGEHVKCYADLSFHLALLWTSAVRFIDHAPNGAPSPCWSSHADTTLRSIDGSPPRHGRCMPSSTWSPIFLMRQMLTLSSREWILLRKYTLTTSSLAHAIMLTGESVLYISAFFVAASPCSRHLRRTFRTPMSSQREYQCSIWGSLVQVFCL